MRDHYNKLTVFRIGFSLSLSLCVMGSVFILLHNYQRLNQHLTLSKRELRRSTSRLMSSVLHKSAWSCLSGSSNGGTTCTTGLQRRIPFWFVKNIYKIHSEVQLTVLPSQSQLGARFAFELFSPSIGMMG
jgi:hypothetical protein